MSGQFHLQLKQFTRQLWSEVNSENAKDSKIIEHVEKGVKKHLEELKTFKLPIQIKEGQSVQIFKPNGEVLSQEQFKAIREKLIQDLLNEQTFLRYIYDVSGDLVGKTTYWSMIAVAVAKKLQ